MMKARTMRKIFIIQDGGGGDNDQWLLVVKTVMMIQLIKTGHLGNNPSIVMTMICL